MYTSAAPLIRSDSHVLPSLVRTYEKTLTCLFLVSIKNKHHFSYVFFRLKSFLTGSPWSLPQGAAVAFVGGYFCIYLFLFDK